MGGVGGRNRRGRGGGRKWRRELEREMGVEEDTEEGGWGGREGSQV